MRILDRSWLTALAAAALVFTASSQQSADSANDTPYKVPRTSWGDPDLSGIWPGTAMVGVPMQRDEKLGLRNWLTEEEYAAREADFARQDELDNADFELENAATTPGGAVGGPVSPPPHWLERGDPQRQASLIIDPSNGRMPPMTEAAQARQAALREASRGRGPADSYTDRSLYDRCITRGMVGSLTPAIYNAGNQIVQSPGYVVITNEMIHEARVIPLDGRPPLGTAIKQWVGDSRGHFDGDTLVVETSELHGPHERRPSAPQRQAQDHGALHARRRRHARAAAHRRGRRDVVGAVDARAAAAARRRLRHVRVRVPRGQSRDVQHPERPSRRRTGSGGATLALQFAVTSTRRVLLVASSGG